MSITNINSVVLNVTILQRTKQNTPITHAKSTSKIRHIQISIPKSGLMEMAVMPYTVQNFKKMSSGYIVIDV